MTNKLLLFFFLFSIDQLSAQRYPVQGSATLIPPYTLRLSEYQTTTSERLVVNLLLADVTKAELPVRFHLSIAGQNIKLETKPEYIGTPISLQGGIPLRLSNLELAEYFDPNHLNFSGISKADFLKTGFLPEGFYTFSLEVYEYHRGVKISGALSAPGWLILNDPPLINLPINGTKLKPFTPQNIVLQWTPRHTSSPNAAFTTEYDVKVVEVWPASRDPNDAMLSQPPIFESTTTNASLIYGPDATQLEPGRTYAFRVQAKAITGTDQFDLFKNNGYSQTSTFIYGDPCNPPAHITAQSESPSRFSLQWDAAPSQTNYTIQYRPTGQNSEWYTNTAVITSTDISGLQPATSYDYQITSTCDSFESSPSTVATFTTAALTDNGYACGMAPPAFNLDASHLIPSLKVGDVIQAGDFDVTITKISGSNGIFSGEGAVVMPFFNQVRGLVTFSGITVNADKRMVAGMMNLTGGAANLVPSAVTSALDVLSQTLSIIDSTLLLAQQFEPATPPDPNSFVADTLITVSGGIKSVKKDILTGNIVLTDNSGKKQTLPPGKNIALADPNGNGTLVSAAGGITSTTAAKAKAAANREYNLVVTFDNTAGSQFGFDGQTLEALSKNYEELNNLYYVAWKAVAAGQTDIVKAIGGERLEASRIHFLQGSSSPVSYTGTPTVNGPDSDLTESLVALYAPADTTKKEQLLGKLNVVGYNPKPFTVHLVPVNGAKVNATEQAIQSQLNTIYGQAVVSWEVHVEDSIHVILSSPFDNGSSGLLSNYTGDMKSVINAYNTTHPLQEGHYYLFIVATATNNNESGYMPRSKQCGFIFSDGKGDASSLVRTMAHELGHGAFTLRHTFEVYPGLSQGSTSNLMDYAGGTVLLKFQWDQIHHPVIVIGLFQSDSSAASVKVYDSIPRLLQNSDHKTVSFLTPSGTIIALPKNVVNVVFFHGIESKKFINLVTGTLVGFTVNDTKYNAVIDETGNFSGYSDGKNYYTRDSITKNIVIEKFIMGLPTNNNFSLYAFSVNSTWSKYSFGKEQVKTESTLGLTLFTVNQVLAKKDLDKNSGVYNESYTGISDAEVSALTKYADTPELLYVLKIKQIQNAYPQVYPRFTSLEDDWDFPFKVRTYSGTKVDPGESTTFEYPIGKWGAIIQASQEKWTSRFNTDKVVYFSAMLDSLKGFIDQYSSRTKNVLLFVNGYRNKIDSNDDFPDSNNKVSVQRDPMNYWTGIDLLFASRIGSQIIAAYADGHHCITTSNHNQGNSTADSKEYFMSSLFGSQCASGASVQYGTLGKCVENCYHNSACVSLHTTPNVSGFAIRQSNGRIAGQDMVDQIKIGALPLSTYSVDGKNGVIDIVAHSMGYAYALGMAEILKGAGYKLGRFYVIAPENACSGNINLTDFDEVWQYGSNERADPVWEQDGVAPQCGVQGLPERPGSGSTQGRIYIPDQDPNRDFLGAHSISSYNWIFNQINRNDAPGYIKKR